MVLLLVGFVWIQQLSNVHIEKALIAIVYAQCRELSFYVEMMKKELLLDI